MSLPRSVSLISDFQKHGLTALDQGNRGDCSLFAITGLVEFEIDQHTPGEHPRLSEDYLIWAADEAHGTNRGPSHVLQGSPGAQ